MTLPGIEPATFRFVAQCLIIRVHMQIIRNRWYMCTKLQKILLPQYSAYNTEAGGYFETLILCLLNCVTSYSTKLQFKLEYSHVRCYSIW